jgi:hypothetical protein
MAQYESFGYEAFEGLEGYKKPVVHHQAQAIEDHHDEYELDYHVSVSLTEILT